MRRSKVERTPSGHRADTDRADLELLLEVAEDRGQRGGDIAGRLGREQRLQRKRPEEPVGISRDIHGVLEASVCRTHGSGGRM